MALEDMTKSARSAPSIREILKRGKKEKKKKKKKHTRAFHFVLQIIIPVMEI